MYNQVLLRRYQRVSALYLKILMKWAMVKGPKNIYNVGLCIEVSVQSQLILKKNLRSNLSLGKESNKLHDYKICRLEIKIWYIRSTMLKKYT